MAYLNLKRKYSEMRREISEISEIPPSTSNMDDSFNDIYPLPQPLRGRSNPNIPCPVDPFRNKIYASGVLVPEPWDTFEMYKHLINLEEDSFVRGDIEDVGEYIKQYGIMNFINKTNYKYSLFCILNYTTVANAQREFIRNL